VADRNLMTRSGYGISTTKGLYLRGSRGGGSGGGVCSGKEKCLGPQGALDRKAADAGKGKKGDLKGRDKGINGRSEEFSLGGHDGRGGTKGDGGAENDGVITGRDSLKKT